MKPEDRVMLLCRFLSLLSLLIVASAGCVDSDVKKAATAAPESPGKATENAVPARKVEAAVANPARVEQVPQRPTIFHALELAKIMDCTKLPVPKDGIADQRNPASLDAKVPGKVPDAAQFYLSKLVELGWAADTGPGGKAITDTYASVMMDKDGHRASLFVSPAGGGKAECAVHLKFFGNFDTRTLPHGPDDSLLYGSQIQTMYTSTTKVPAKADWVKKELLKQGWQIYVESRRADSPSDELRLFDLRKEGYALGVFISSAKAEGKPTTVQYGVAALGHELPAPADATDIEFDDSAWTMRCDSPSNMEATADYYRKAMPAAGYKPLSGEKPQDKYINLRFGTDAGDIVLVNVTAKAPHHSAVSAFGVPAKVIEKMQKEDEKAAAAARRKLQ
jgi:hypothetical protein